ncbi:2,4'-dihydroxyacetophenone dioxygenase family protein [Nocardioides ultimimeridianus]
MTISATPGPVFTASGSPLPVVALPQGELLSIDSNDVALLENALGKGVHFKPLRLDLEAGEWVVLATFEPGSQVPFHYHTGVAEVFTFSGSWHYLEYPESPQTAGCYLYEPGGSAHTFVCPATNTENTTILVRVVGANINFAEDGTFHSILDASLIRFVADQLAEAQGVAPINYIGGGAAGMTAGG